MYVRTRRDIFQKKGKNIAYAKCDFLKKILYAVLDILLIIRVNGTHSPKIDGAATTFHYY